MYLTNSEEARLLTMTMTGTRLALLTAMGTDTVAGTELSGGGYIRCAITPSTPGPSGVGNASSVLFLDLPEAALVGWELWSTDGTQRRWYGYWQPMVTVYADSLFNVAAHGLLEGDRILFVGGQAPGGITANQIYYVRDVTSSTFRVSATAGATAVTVTGSGSSTFGRVLSIPAGEALQISPNNLLLSMD